jgi:farnesyl-diphosphate farnesyltransferase
MLPVPFALRRPWLITRDLLQSRSHPDLARLRAIGDAESFVWRILPHAARTFTACITLLPADSARAMAVAYLYCRMLDTYEDLLPDAAEREQALAAFGARFGGPDGAALAPAPRIARARARDARDQTHVVLVNRCRLVDEVFASLQPVVQEHTADLVRSMAEGMIRSSEAFRDQGGVLTDADQLSRYCRTVIGLPFLFAVRLHLLRRTGDATLSDALREDTLQAGEMVQLANVTRDIEKDLRRGIAYHPALAGDLGKSESDPALRERTRAVRDDLLQRALRLAPAYQRMMQALPFARVSLARASGVLMLAFTDRYYRACAERVGRAAWPGPRSAIGLIVRSAGHVVSPELSARTIRRITAAFLNATDPGR